MYIKLLIKLSVITALEAQYINTEMGITKEIITTKRQNNRETHFQELSL